MCVCVFVCVFICVCVCLCVCVNPRNREKKGPQNTHTNKTAARICDLKYCGNVKFLAASAAYIEKIHHL